MTSSPTSDPNDPINAPTESTNPPDPNEPISYRTDPRLRPRRNLRPRLTARKNSIPSNSAAEPAIQEPGNTPKCTEPPETDTPFPLLSLPAELRIHIYRMALCRPTPLFLHISRPRNKPPQNNDYTSDTDDTTNNIIPSLGHGTVRIGNHRYTWSDALNRCIIETDNDAISPALLRTCHQIYAEARPVLYADNTFILHIESGVHTLSSLHQRSRSLIKDVTLTIPSHHDILDGFADIVRLGLRYCWGLKRFTIVLPGHFPEGGVVGNEGVYANAFRILRWLPRGCGVVLEGGGNEGIVRVVEDEGRLRGGLDEEAYIRRQHQMPEKWRFGSGGSGAGFV